MQKIFLPHRDAAQTTWQWFTACVAVSAFLLASAELARDGDDTAPWQMASGIDCSVDVGSAASATIRLTNVGPVRLSQGQSVAWTTLGTPAPHGEVQRLPEDLQPGNSVPLDSAQLPNGSGCMARALR